MAILRLGLNLNIAILELGAPLTTFFIHFWVFFIVEPFCIEKYGQLGQDNMSQIEDGPGEMGDMLPPIDLDRLKKAEDIAARFFRFSA